MDAAVFDTSGGPVRLQRIPVPQCPPSGVVVQVRATGVCRSDWHAWLGHDAVALPHVPGHEFAGVISAVGEDVRRWSVGDRVTAPFVLGCGTCSYCVAGDPQVCPRQQQPGFSYQGSFAEYVVVPSADFNLVGLPDALPFEQAAALGCRFATSYRAVAQLSRVQAGQYAAIWGCGGVGLSAVLIASALGARVIAVDVNPTALDRAQELGAADAVLLDLDAKPAETARAVRALTDDGVHVTVETSGSQAGVQAGIRSLRPRGRHVQVGLLVGEDAQSTIPLDHVRASEIEIHGSHGMAARDYPAMFELIESKRIPLAQLIGQRIPLDEAGSALDSMSHRQTTPGITIIDIDDAEHPG